MKIANRKSQIANWTTLGAMILFTAIPLVADDWTMFGGTPIRNMVNNQKNPPTQWDVEKGTNIKWTAELGSKSYAGPVIAEGVVYIGTNNEAQKDPKEVGDRGVLMAYKESDGTFLWQRAHQKLPSGRVNDWPGEGLCSTPLVENGKLYYGSNRCEMICLDVSAGVGNQPKEVWNVDMMKRLGVFPHNMTSCSPVTYGDFVYMITANGVDDTHRHVVSPNAPSIVCFNKNTGNVEWSDNSPGDRVMHASWGSPSIIEVNGKTLVLAPLGDGWVRAYDAKTGSIIWKCDLNRKDWIYPNGKKQDALACPVVVDNRLYISTGQDPEHGEGPGHILCIDVTKTGDISAELDNPNAPKPKAGNELLADAPAAAKGGGKGIANPNSGIIWEFEEQDFDGDGRITEKERMHRSTSTVAVYNGLVFAADFNGFLWCFDAKTGKVLWNHDGESQIWGSPMCIDGKIYLGNQDGRLRIFEAGPKLKLIADHDMGNSIYSTPVFANGTLYVMTMDKLYAIGEKK
ncbi:MAG TPA: PQQ-binding-like beta-propeller repeat protein [Tepidisphaeraceae bacterium]|nr:PQQ-binding-like beta-propeller repeat protein [Tepidisphaeraceae bacterium]